MNLSDAYKLMHDGSTALARVEAAGIRVDEAYLDKAIAQTDIRIKKLSEKVKQDETYKVWLREFGDNTNLDSGQQLARVLFGILRHPCKRKTKTGHPATGKADLAEIDHPFVRRLVKLRALKKLKSVSLEGLRRELVDGYLHPDLNLHTASSFRGSSGGQGSKKTYNTQNVPSRDEKAARLVRRAFIPRPGRVLVENDFSSHEFKVAANVWGDPLMRQYAADKSKDIHRDMASECFLADPKDIGKVERYVGKNGFVFPRLYGSYYKQIAKNIWREMEDRKLQIAGVPMRQHLQSKGIEELGKCDPQDRNPPAGTYERHIKDVEERFMNRFHVFAENCERAWQDYQKTGRFDMVTGFRVEGLYTRNQVLNIKVQGPAFHCLLWTLIELVSKELRKMKSLVVNQVHDCLNGDVPRVELQDYLWLVKEIVEERLPKAWDWLVVPLEIEAEVAEESWADKVPWIVKDGIWVSSAKT